MSGKPNVDPALVARAASNYPWQAGRLHAGLGIKLNRIEEVLALLPEEECNDIARVRLQQIRDDIAAELALFDAIEEAERGD